MKINYLECPKKIPLIYSSEKNHFMMTESIEVRLSDGRLLLIPKGYTTRLFSKANPWKLNSPLSRRRVISKLIHKRLWTEKISEIEYFGSIYEAFVFSNTEYYKWKIGLIPRLKILHFLENLYYKHLSINSYIKTR
ncbi:conserved protein of unknown function [Tenacibaculum jejuense]|uniref:Uncharacterized protein n=2 Tax=Tenacibaculum jejuense TaxID=584609 RepID=A0A238UD77_9FLAO|nr:conserved protein of unknown function [Tenacibaculum jejuense]